MWPSSQGQKLFETLSKQAWQDWLAHQTMLINEKQLNMMDPESRAYLQGELDKFISGDDYDKADGYVPPAAEWRPTRIKKITKFHQLIVDSKK